LVSLCEEAGPDCLNTLPEAVSACLPTSLRFKIDSSVDRVRGLPEDAFRKWAEENLGEGLRIEFELRRLTNPSLQDWKATIEKNPNLALMLWDAAAWQFLLHGTKPPLLDSAEGIDALIEEFLQHPEFLLEHAQSWGKLLQSAAPRRVPELKSAILAACSGPVARNLLLVGQPSGFAVDLPEDALLLPHLVNVLIEACVPRYSFDDFHMASGRSLIEASMLEKLRMLVSQFVPDRSCLEQVSAAGQNSKDVRAAAIILYCLHPSRLLKNI
jgi:hypothetical protein